MPDGAALSPSYLNSGPTDRKQTSLRHFLKDGLQADDLTQFLSRCINTQILTNLVGTE